MILRYLASDKVYEDFAASPEDASKVEKIRGDLAPVNPARLSRAGRPQFLPMCGPCGPCVPSVGHCDPKEADSAATIGSPA